MFYLLDKEKDISSFKTIRNFAKENNIKKIGHTGTLDPMATGLLLVATDEDTKLIDYIDKGFKNYIVKLKLGFVSDTYDAMGKVTKTNSSHEKSNVIPTIISFVKTYDQMPPSFSAKKINGQRAYDLARSGKEFKLKPSRITIKEIRNAKAINFDEYEFELKVSRGTYIRSIVSEIGEKLGCGAIMTYLRRNKIGNLSLLDVGSNIDVKSLLTLDILQICDIKKLMQGKEVFIPARNGKYALEFNDEIIGFVELINSKVIKRKLLGKKCERLANESCKIPK